tara:strand:+ start:1817 stop:2485 length:669 start_codon:yes stop_codon:yes gene_type:complete
MESIKKNIRGEKFIFDKSGSIFLENLKTLIFSDLHLGKSLSFADHGNLIPPFDLDETLLNLKNIIERYKPKRLISLGDSFHENKSIQKMKRKYVYIINNLLRKVDITWIEGNHDSNLLFKDKIQGNFKNFYKLKNFKFVHSKSQIDEVNLFEFSGHYHPKITLKFNGVNYSYKCFILTDNFCILPSFGTYTGGLDIKSNALQKILPINKQIIILGNNKIKEI